MYTLEIKIICLLIFILFIEKIKIHFTSLKTFTLCRFMQNTLSQLFNSSAIIIREPQKSLKNS